MDTNLEQLSDRQKWALFCTMYDNCQTYSKKMWIRFPVKMIKVENVEERAFTLNEKQNEGKTRECVFAPSL